MELRGTVEGGEDVKSGGGGSLLGGSIFQGGLEPWRTLCPPYFACFLFLTFRPPPPSPHFPVTSQGLIQAVSNIGILIWNILIWVCSNLILNKTETIIKSHYLRVQQVVLVTITNTFDFLVSCRYQPRNQDQ